MSADEERLGPIIEAIGDDAPVLWERWESEARDAEELDLLATLRRVQTLAAFSRSRQRQTTPAELGAPGAWGPLVLREPLGHGSTGTVWRAWEPRLQREVALKLLTADAADDITAGSRLLDEGRLLAQVRHPGVAAVYSLEEHAGRIGLCMELISGETLESRVARSGPLSAGEVIHAGLSLAQALAAIHAAGLLHRDIKAANVLRETGGRLVLTDFGLGQRRATGQAGWAERLSGTPMYMAPEVLNGGPATPTSDVYGLGMLLYFLATGRYPWDASSLGELRRAQEAGPVRRLRDARADLPVALIRVIERALHADPAGRYAGASALETALSEALEAMHQPPASARAEATPRSRVGHGALALLSLLVVAVVALVLSQRAGTPPPAETPYDVEAFLRRVGDDRPAPLRDGDRVAPGDRLMVEFMASRAMHVYVLNEDERGEAYLLFPQPAYDLANPLPAGRRHRLPGPVAGRAAQWTVTSAGGREHFLVVASPEALSEVERALAALPAPERGRRPGEAPVRLSPEIVRRLRGVGGFELGPAPADSVAARPLFAVVRRLAGRESGVRGVWFRQISLENPGK